jgi:hypothetical protein
MDRRWMTSEGPHLGFPLNAPINLLGSIAGHAINSVA